MAKAECLNAAPFKLSEVRKPIVNKCGLFIMYRNVR